MANKLTKDEEKAIADRVEKAMQYLKENDLILDAVVYATNIGRDQQDHATFGMAVVPYLQNVRFSKKDEVSPIQAKDIKYD